jgi:NIMA (never in mitosis gene a)-related kinase
LGEDNSVKLGDFGLSKMIKSHDFASTYVGTPFYMSPEICAAEKYTLKSDIWSLGCIIYELCAREPPFNAKTHFQLVQRIKEGKVATLPEMYSPELNQVIRDCLKVNPDRRPDTIQLLNLPVVRLMRKEKEVVDLNKSLRAKEDLFLQKEKELNDRLVNLNRERQMIRDEIDSSLRREWEVKARLEIDRLANTEIEQLQQRFEEEIKMRVDAELRRLKELSIAPTEGAHSARDEASSAAKPDNLKSLAEGGGGDEFPSTADLTEYPTESPDAANEPRRAARTPFGRAQTMFAGHAGTPMDIEMASPSPMAIANLSLSPRRGGATKAPTTHSGNIFAANANRAIDPRWDLREPLSNESDDEDVVPSPTRNIRSAKNPFTSKTRPVLTSQKTCPINRLKPQTSATGLVSKTTLGAAQGELRPRSPTRQISKIPSMTSLQTDLNGNGLARKHSVKKDINGSEALNKMAAKNNIKGRTLVELQQARAGGRPLSAAGGALENISPKRATFKERVAGERRGSGGSGSSSSSGSESVAVWDPERDEMPSPFLVRQKRFVKV